MTMIDARPGRVRLDRDARHLPQRRARRERLPLRPHELPDDIEIVIKDSDILVMLGKSADIRRIKELK